MLGMKGPPPVRKPEHTKGDVHEAIVGLVRAHSAARVWLGRHVDETWLQQGRKKAARTKAGKVEGM
jgi:hypothetical protein